MVKKANKRRRTIPERNAKLEELLNDDAKDDEERRLESLLFGVAYTPKNDSNGISTWEGNEETVEDPGKELHHLPNNDLFFVDQGELLEPNSESERSNAEGSRSDSESVQSESNKGVNDPPPVGETTTHKRPAWTDPMDRAADASVSLLSGPSRLRKLRIAPDEDTICGREYETRLRRQFERIHPAPEWATKGKRRAGALSDEEENEEGVDILLSSTSGIISRRRKTVLPAGTLEIERLRDANLVAQGAGTGEVKVVTFHPSEKIPVLAVATADRRVRLFNVDEHTNPLLQTLHTPALPYTHSSLSFHPRGTSLLLTGTRPFFFTHNLETGTTVRHDRGLWGSWEDSTLSTRKRGRNDGALNSKEKDSLLLTAFSPDTGEMLAVSGRGGYVHLVDWRSGSAQVVGSLKCSGGGGVRGLWWVPPGAGVEGLGSGAPYGQLASLTGDAEVYLWDVGQRKCVRRWKDEGGFRGAARALAGAPSWLAIGSTSGFVNVYGSDALTPHVSDTPKPLKVLGNLVTPISALRFNHDAQLLAIASKDKKDAMRFIHLPSLTAFANWPTSSTPLGHVTSVDFSPRSRYAAIGNTRGRVLLYHLKYYGNNGGM